tara:strand:+ start:290 stop:853 length:564 start_codon:yes stop_codon:yes gene_type:complete
MIDFTTYDTSYELQSMQLMIDILQPHIFFKKPTEDIANMEIQIYKMVDGTIDNSLTIKEYIHFIQIIFPKMIQKEINSLYDQKRKETIKKEIFDSRRSNGQFRLPLFLETGDNNVYEAYTQDFNKMNVEELTKMEEYYKDGKKLYHGDMKLIDEQSTYLENIRDFNRKMNGTIQDVIQFIRNLEYYL